MRCARPERLCKQQPVAHGRLGQQVFGLRRVNFELLAQVTHVNAQVMALLGVRRSPDLAQQLPVREQKKQRGALISSETGRPSLAIGGVDKRCKSGTHSNRKRPRNEFPATHAHPAHL